jgi:5-methylcytosine-specific restriction protein A
MKFPELKISSRNGEYNSYSIVIRAEVVYRYLFEGLSHRNIDKITIGLVPDESRGWQSMGILHHIGLIKEHKGIFTEIELSNAISLLKKGDETKYDLLIKHLEVFNSKVINTVELEKELNNSILKSYQSSKKDRLARLKLRDNHQPKQINTVSKAYIRNADVIVEVLERANGICEHCSKPAPFTCASDNTPYLEVHQVIPLAEGGLDNIENTIALCPNCHRELHYGK